ncbi:MAG: SusF/SusE family outer membrane protein [Flavobacterium sp.]|nr:SusF/SusE family outer membrane protein [Flavobacterium sp.]
MFKKLCFSLILFNALCSFAQPTDLYMVGDAAPVGWHIENALIMTPVPSSGMFEYTGPLFPGEFKLAVSQNSCWCQDFYVRDTSDATKMVLNGADNKWTITTLAQYHVVVNTVALTIDIQQVSATPIYTKFWMIGSATTAGWSMDGATSQPFVQNPSNPAEFVYEGSLVAGDFKVFAGAFNNFCGTFYNPMQNGQPFTDSSAQLVTNCSADFKWTIATPGTHRITVNTTNSTVTILDSAGILSVSKNNISNFNVYPNPAKVGWNFSSSNEIIERIQILDISGKTLRSVSPKSNNAIIDASGLSNGIYFAKVDTGKETNTIKLIKE